MPTIHPFTPPSPLDKIYKIYEIFILFLIFFPPGQILHRSRRSSFSLRPRLSPEQETRFAGKLPGNEATHDRGRLLPVAEVRPISGFGGFRPDRKSIESNVLCFATCKQCLEGFGIFGTDGLLCIQVTPAIPFCAALYHHCLPLSEKRNAACDCHKY